MVVVSMVLGCDGADIPAAGDDPAVETGTVASTVSDSADSGDGPTSPSLCDDLPPGPFELFTTGAVHTEEDFDFDKDGFLLTQGNTSLLGFARTGQSHVVAPNIGADAAGIRSLPSGDVVVAQPDTGSLKLVTFETGATNTLLGGLVFPNGIEVGEDGFVYSTEYAPDGRVRQIDPLTADAKVITTLDFPNNLALSPDEQTLYIIVSNGPLGGSGAEVVALDRATDGVWGSEARVVATHAEQLGGITTDSCGNVYVSATGSGWIVRLVIATGETTTIATLPSGGLLSQYTSLRFGSGIGEWRRSELFVTNRVDLTVLDVGVDGRHVLGP